MFVPKIACVSCGVAMKIEKNGFVVEMITDGRPYYKIHSDLYKCPSCGTEVATGFAHEALAEHYQSHYKNVSASSQVELNP